MARPVVFVAGMFLIAAVGCFNNSFLNQSTSSTAYKEAAGRAPKVVAAVLEEGLGCEGISVLVKQQGEEIRLVGQSKSGGDFCLYVRPNDAVPGGSVVSVRWGRKPDDQLWKSVVAWLKVCNSEKDSGT